LIFLLIATLVTGAAGYYFKIFRPKRQATNNDDDERGIYPITAMKMRKLLLRVGGNEVGVALFAVIA